MGHGLPPGYREIEETRTGRHRKSGGAIKVESVMRSRRMQSKSRMFEFVI